MINNETSTSKPQMPHSREAEQALLGGILVDPDIINCVVDALSPDDIYVAAHRSIYTTMLEINKSLSTLDVITLVAGLESKGILAEVGGVTYISGLADDIASSAGIESCVEIIKDRALKRRLVALSSATIKKTLGTDTNLGELLPATEAELKILIEQHTAQNGIAATSSVQLFLRVVEHLEELHKKGKAITGVPTGFTDLDKLIGGLQPAELIIIAARPSMGKTALAMNIAQHVSLNGVGVGVLTYEMSPESLMTRMLATMTGIDLSVLRSGQLHDGEWKELAGMRVVVEEQQLYIAESTPTIESLVLAARKMKRDHDIGLLVIDYLQLISAGRRSSTREQEISEISRALKTLAKELNIPVVALSQLNRAPELREKNNKRPRLSDLRESGAIEQDADVIMFIYRDEVYSKDKEENKGIAEVIVGKHRNGPTGAVELYWSEKTTTFRNLYPRARAA